MALRNRKLGTVEALQGQILQETDAGAVVDNERVYQGGSGAKYEDISSQTYKTSIAKIRAAQSLNPNIIYKTMDFGVPGEWEVDEADTTSLDNTGTILVTASGQRLKRRINGPIELLSFGAIGDGVTDDTIPVLDWLSCGFSLMASPGLFSVSQISITNKIELYGNLKIKAGDGFINGEPCINLKIGSEDSYIESIDFDLDNKPASGLFIDSDRVVIKSVKAKNCVGPAVGSGNGLISALVVTGSNCHCGNVYAENFSDDVGNPQSVPRIVTIAGGASNTTMDTISGLNIHGGITLGSSTHTNVGKINIINAGDNPLYAVTGSEKWTVGEIYCYNSNEIVACSNTNNGSISLIHSINSGNNIIRLLNSNNITVDSMVVREDETYTAIGAALVSTHPSNTNSTNITINNIVAEHRKSFGVFNFTNGTVENFAISNFDITTHYHSGTGNLAILPPNGLVGKFSFKNGRIKIIDDTGTLTGADFFTINLPVPTEISYWCNVHLECLTGPFKIRVNGAISEFTELSEAILEDRTGFGPVLRDYGYKRIATGNTEGTNKIMYGDRIPLNGTYKKGDVIYNIVPVNNGNRGWVCTTSGTPGTWEPFGIIGKIEASADSAPAQTTMYVQADVQAILDELRDLKTKMRAAGLLAS